MNSLFPNIVCGGGVLNGSPRIDGRRLAVGDVVSTVYISSTFNEAKEMYDLSIDEIRQALLYCSSLQCKADNPFVFCHNCSLRTEQEDPINIFDLEEHTLNNETKIVKGENVIFLGSMEEYLEESKGKNWWDIATNLLIDHRNRFA